MNRRTVLTRAVRGAGALAALASSPVAAPALLLRGRPSERIRIGLAGAGDRGLGHLRALGYPEAGREDGEKPIPDTEVVAICDAFEDHLDAGVAQVAAHGPKPARYVDYRKMLDEAQLDVLVIATPDHLHAPIAMAAAQAGCDVYVEKCMTNSAEEAIELGRVLQETGRILQVGYQLHQDRIYRLAAEVVASGALGKVHAVQLFLNRGGWVSAWGREIAQNGGPPREKVHWDLFLGDAPKVPYDPHRYFEWRRFWDYSTGISGDMFSHSLAAAHHLVGLGFPATAVASGGIYRWKDGRETPDTFNVALEYPERDVSVTYLASLANQYPFHMTRVFGGDATMQVSWRLDVYPDRFSERYRKELESGELGPRRPLLSVSGDGAELTTDAAPTSLWLEGRGMMRTVRDGRVVDTTRLHHEELIACARERRQPSASYDSALTSTIGCHMATAAYRLGTRMRWDAETGTMAPG